METIIKTGFQSITHKIQFQPQTLVKGKKLVLAEHVREVEEFRKNNESYLIKSRVIRQASVHATAYTTSLKLNVKRYVVDVQCNCVYNRSKKCKHIAALIYFINHENSASKTSIEQQWGKPSARQFAKDKYSKGAYFENMIPHKYDQLHDSKDVEISELVSDCPLKQILIAQSSKNNFHTARNVLNSLITQVELNIEKEDCAECVNNFLIFYKEHLTYSRIYELDNNIKEFYMNNIVLSEEHIVTLACETLDQSLCENWFKARHLRISASTNVHNIKTLNRKSIESLVSDFLNKKKIDTASTRYGLKNEPIARDKYETLYNCEVKRVGVIVKENQPWLCGSIDGVVIDDGCITKIVEIKCPSSCEKKAVVNFNDKSCNVKYLKFVEDQLIVKRTDVYYTQMQVQMYITGMTVCDLFVYSPLPNGSCLIEVHRDEDFIQAVIIKSEQFYFQNYLPALYKAVLTKELNCNSSLKENENLIASEDEELLENRTFTGMDISNNLD